MVSEWLQRLACTAVAFALAASGGCADESVGDDTGDDEVLDPGPSPNLDESVRDPSCPARAEAPSPLPGTTAEHLTLDYWLHHLGERYDLDRTVLGTEEIARINAAMQTPRDKYFPQRDLLGDFDLAEWQRRVNDRQVWARDGLRDGTYLQAGGQPVPAGELAIYDESVALDEVRPQLRVALDEIPLRCSPRQAPFYSKSLDLRFDRNACSTARPQEVIQLIARWPNGMWLAGTRYAFGWIADDAPLSPVIPDDLRETFVTAPRVQLLGDLTVATDGGAEVMAQRGTLVPAADRRGRRVYVADAAGFHRSGRLRGDQARSTRRVLTRRAVLEELWRFIDAPFGLGGADGGRDCSRILMDMFETFDLHLPRHSGWQSLTGSFWIDIDQDLAESERLLLIDAAADKGLVLLHFPGHIMFYLGRDRQGVPMVYHAFSEYLASCTDSPDTSASDRGGDPSLSETVVEVAGATVSNLELGRGSSRTAFIERLNRITVLGGSPGPELSGLAEMRPAAAVARSGKCRDSRRQAIFFSPERPSRDQPLRIIASLDRDPGPAALTLIDPDGEQHRPEVVRLGGPPFGYVATVDSPQPGRWTAILGDGDRVVACDRVRVASRARKVREEDPAGPIWKPRRGWGTAMDNLYALFVERLLDYPIEEDRVWPNLHSLTRDSSRNILYNHRGLGEDEQLTMQPDCADLPYNLRAYFAWKMRLPFGYRRCKRARSGRPPDCAQPGGDDNLMSRLELGPRRAPEMRERGDVEAFDLFIKRRVQRSVHSSSGRTLSDAEESDMYPVPLTREALRPGTVFIDPYGHVLLIADWVPQGVGERYGILVGVDAQPDGTVGRRRFWRGSFLFNPATEAGASGFKAFRPRTFSAEPLEVSYGPDGREYPEPDDDPLPGDDSDSLAIDADDGDDDDGRTVIARIGYTEEVDNETLRRTRRYTRISFQQYRGTKNDFYERMDSLINPRPLDPVAVQRSLIDALEESVQRRVNSVDNGEAYMAESGYAPMDMPEGARIFLAEDPWESFSTPSRDLRLLISIDSVIGFPDLVARSPQRFGLESGPGLEQTVDRVRQALDSELRGRQFAYTRSDGSQHTLTLGDVVARQKGFEMAYNPNDCPEVRWAAPEGSDEIATCRRRAPAEQHTRMESYRSWFVTRDRPAN